LLFFILISLVETDYKFINDMSVVLILFSIGHFLFTNGVIGIEKEV